MADEEKKSWLSRLKSGRTVIAFWFMGLCNNTCYVVMLSAAHDILKQMDHDDQVQPDYERACNTMTTGLILLVDVVPGVLIRFIAPFIPQKIFWRMAIILGLSVASLLLVATRANKPLVLIGVAFTSLSQGLGESSLLGYMVFFSTKNVISGWSSGTGAAGIVGSVSYLGLISLGLSLMVTMFLMLIWPIVQGIAFFFFIEHPTLESKDESQQIPTEPDQMTMKEKIQIMPLLLYRYMLPFGLVYFFEYFINQGLYELLYFPKSILGDELNFQYRLYSVLYQVGVFISRSSMNIVKMDHLWLLAGLQGLNFLICLAEAMFGYMHSILIMVLVILYEGLLGGCSYVNTYRRIATEMQKDKRQYSMAICGISDGVMITLAGLFAIPVHNTLCNWPKPYPYNTDEVQKQRATNLFE